MENIRAFIVALAVCCILVVVQSVLAAPTGISVESGTATNEVIGTVPTHTIFWTDAAGMSGESYNVYVSSSPITDIDGANVYRIATKIPESTENFEYGLYTPFTGGSVSNYYAVVTVSAASQVDKTVAAGQNATTSATSGTSIYAPAFWWFVTPPTIDGNGNDWTKVPKARLAPSLGNAVAFDPYDSDADQSADVGLGVDKNAFYVYYEVTDDIPLNETQGNTKDLYKGDAVELYIATYDFRPSANLGERTGMPNYHAYAGGGGEFHYEATANNDGDINRTWLYNRFAGDVAHLNPGVIDHQVASKVTDKGYNVEFALPVASLENVVDRPPLHIAPEIGWNMVFNLAMDDSDAPGSGRQSQIFLSTKGAEAAGGIAGTDSWVGPKAWHNIGVVYDPKFFGVSRAGETAVEATSWGNIKARFSR